jgi:hypothetical protein
MNPRPLHYCRIVRADQVRLWSLFWDGQYQGRFSSLDGARREAKRLNRSPSAAVDLVVEDIDGRILCAVVLREKPLTH